MKARSLTSAQEFLDATLTFRSADPVMTNLLGSIATSVAGGRQYEKCHWWIVEDQGHVVGAAVRTVPFKLIFSPMNSQALDVLCPLIMNEDPDFSGISGPRPLLTEAAHRFPYAFSEHMAMLIYVLDELNSPEVPGRSRKSEAKDIDLLLAWFDDFAAEANVNNANDVERLKTFIKDGWYTIWEDGEVVAFAGNAQNVDTDSTKIGRVGPVYTPPEQRRRGYGAAVTAAVTQRLKDQGCDVVMLYTDASNPTSNSIYQAIGYRLVAEWADWDRN